MSTTKPYSSINKGDKYMTQEERSLVNSSMTKSKRFQRKLKFQYRVVEDRSTIEKTSIFLVLMTWNTFGN